MKTSPPLKMEKNFATSLTRPRSGWRSLSPRFWLPVSGLAVLLAGCHRGATAPPAPPGFQLIAEGNPALGTIIYDGQGNLVGKVLGMQRIHHFTDGSDDGPAIQVEPAKAAGGTMLYLTPLRIATLYYKKIGATPAPLTANEMALVPSQIVVAPPAPGKPASGGSGSAASGTPIPFRTIAPIPITTLPPSP